VQRIVDDSQQQQHHASKFVEDKTGITIIALSLQSPSVSPSVSPLHGPSALFFLV
jgi:hypothetical protein